MADKWVDEVYELCAFHRDNFYEEGEMVADTFYSLEEAIRYVRTECEDDAKYIVYQVFRHYEDDCISFEEEGESYEV